MVGGWNYLEVSSFTCLVLGRLESCVQLGLLTEPHSLWVGILILQQLDPKYSKREHVENN